MSEAITSRQFHESPGVGEWDLTADVASASFLTGSFARGVELVDVVGSLADAMNHHPDVDLRYSLVTIRLTTHSLHSLSNLDVALARQISEAARKLGISANNPVTKTDSSDAST